MKHINVLLALLLCMALLLGLTACGETAAELETAGEVETATATEDAADGETVLTLWSYGGDEPTLEDWIEECEQTLSVRIEIVSYYYDEDGNRRMPDEIRAILRENLEAGTAPDLILYFPAELSDAELAAYMTDLYPYLDADEELGREDMVSSVLSGLEVDGSLYAVSPAFSLYSVASRASAIDPDAAWDLDALAALANSVGGPDFLMADTDGSSLFLNLFEATDQYVEFDTQTQSATLNTDAFRQLLSLCKQTETMQTDAYDEAPLLWASLQNYQEYEEISAQLGGEVTWVGVPGVMGWLVMADPMGITAACQEQELAWACIRLLLTEDYQYEQYVDKDRQSPMFVTNVAALERLEAKSAETMVQDQIDQINKLIAASVCDRAYVYSNPYADLQVAVHRSVMAYFEGEATLDEAVAAAQAAVEAYSAS